ncbi:Cobalt-precorrin-3B C(17)-methyltransferase [[Clostridium] ultunense Esp]|uniref:Cobalt-precorrin-3B C(17)-methyltransferase n=1 Tax=[Clostridium] ultunense Esp TaxID=1288971 RepID=M1ZA66_9FIRM|nr:precorrin-3B C(17)-methyltransferase [Schnuerera ultunensis]CCQ94759.1 Cobalt-precorrin-3B C(17)-methyltransferase [[Clostridium] ultunense Esp]SHD77581.1 Cobalt-precorrin-3B C(17)-methyltransferase [[Clostridium] ultunense Esp]
MAKLYVIGIGPGGREHMTLKAVETIKKSDIIVGYTPYIDYLGDLVKGKEIYSTGMKGEIERCKLAIKKVKEGKNTAIISTGDAGLYGMAGPILELKEDIEVEIIPGVTAAFSAASELGSPIMHDFASISLSDLLTPWEVIEKRIEKAAEGDFVIAIYNPRSKGRKDHLEKAVEIMLKYKEGDTPVGIVKNSGRGNTEIILTTLVNISYEKVDMLSILIIGNSNTYVKDDQMITPRGYHIR